MRRRPTPTPRAASTLQEAGTRRRRCWGPWSRPASRLGTDARPAIPAIPPSTRLRVTRGLLGDGPSGERGASGFAMISSSDPSRRGRFCPVRTTCEQTVTGSHGLSIGEGVVSTLLCDFVCDLVDLWGEVTQSWYLTTEQRETDG